jgi:hypothetical protein
MKYIQQEVRKTTHICLEEVLTCAKEKPLITDSVSEYVDALQILLDTLLARYTFVQDIILQEDMDAFLERCAQASAYTGE